MAPEPESRTSAGAQAGAQGGAAAGDDGVFSARVLNQRSPSSFRGVYGSRRSADTTSFLALGNSRVASASLAAQPTRRGSLKS